MTAPQLSPGREWWWTGTEWVAAASHPDGASALAALATPPPAPAPAPPPVPMAAAPVAAEPAWAPAPVTVLPPAAPQYWQQPPPFDTLGLVALLCNLVPFLALGNIAAIVLSKRADRERLRQGFPPSGVAQAARIIGWVLSSIIAVGIIAAILIPVFLSQRHLGQQHAVPTVASAAIEGDARQAVDIESGYHQQFGIFATMPGLVADGFTPTPGVTTQVVHADRSSYCLQVSSAGASLFYDSTTDQLSQTPCR